MFERLGHLAVRRTKLLLSIYFISLAVFGGLGIRVFGELQSQGYANPSSESSRAASALAKKFQLHDPLLAISVVTPHGVETDSAEATTIVSKIFAEPGVDTRQSISYWTTGKLASLRSDAAKGQESKAGLVLISSTLQGKDSSQLAKRIQDKYDGTQANGLRVLVGGWGVIGNELNGQIASDLARAESVAIPLSVLALLFAFGSVVAAGLPFLVAAGAILATMFSLWLLAQATDISVFALNLVTGFGLGLGIDYALLMVSRFRETLKTADSVEDAIVQTMKTAGRTVFVSGVTVAVTLAGLVVFPQYFMKSFAYSGFIVVAFAILTSLTALPAAFAALGHKVNKGKLRRGDLAPTDEGRWHDIAIFVMRRPVAVFLVAIIGLLALAMPALSAKFSQIDDRALPASNPGAQAAAYLRDNFSSQASSPIDIFLPNGGDEAASNDIAAWGTVISKFKHVVRVTTPDYVFANAGFLGPNANLRQYISGKDARVSVLIDVPARSTEATAIVDKIRSLNEPRTGTLVGGAPAIFVDSQRAVTDHIPFLLLWLGIATIIILFLFTGSVILPIKAVILNVLSLSATVGVLTYIFQGHHLTWLVGDFTPTHNIDTNSMVIVAVVAFGLSMDYEVFLLARIKEEHDRGADTTTSVALGLQRSGRIITTAAVLLSVVFASFVSSGVTNIKQLGLGVAFAIVLDATVVRAFLVPAFMRLAGRANWWAPKPLARIYQRFGMSD